MEIKDFKSSIVFNEEKHKYYDKRGKELISCSTLIKLYSPKFDPTGAIIERCAEKKGITVEELRKEWDKERDNASEKGHEFHKQAENWVKTGEIDKNSRFSGIVEQISKLPFKGKLHPETMVVSRNFGVAGTVDLLDEYGNKELDIWDYKTNKQLKKKSFFSRNEGGYKMMLHPIDHLMDCNYVHYSLQLHIYSLIMEENGYWANDKTLIYINPKTNLIELHPVLSVREEALTIIKHHNNMKSW